MSSSVSASGEFFWLAELQLVSLLYHSMPLLRVAKAKAVANTSTSGASPGSRVMSLVDLDRMDSLPLSPVTVIGRLQLKYGTQERYPCAKWVLGGQKVNDENDAVCFLVKFSNVPRDDDKYQVDALIKITCAEVSACWKRPDGHVP